MSRSLHWKRGCDFSFRVTSKIEFSVLVNRFLELVLVWRQEKPVGFLFFFFFFPSDSYPRSLLRLPNIIKRFGKVCGHMKRMYKEQRTVLIVTIRTHFTLEFAFSAFFYFCSRTVVYNQYFIGDWIATQSFVFVWKFNRKTRMICFMYIYLRKVIIMRKIC